MRQLENNLATRAVKLLPGEYFASAEAVAVVTLLGSCVSVCLYDRGSGIGGMNHFMLPDGKGGGSPRYGSSAIELLLGRLQQLGASRARLEAKLFGGGRVLAGAADIGGMNASFALEYLRRQKVPVVASDLGECSPRKVVFFTATGVAYVKRVGAKVRQGEGSSL